MPDKTPDYRTPATASDGSERLAADQVSLLYRQVVPACAINLAVSTGLAWVVAAEVPWPRLLIWLAMMVAVTAWRAILGVIYQRRAVPQADAASWQRRYLASVTLNGASWGSVAFLLYPYQSAQTQLFTVFALGGMTAGAVPLLSAARLATPLFVVPALMPLIVRLGLAGDRVSIAMCTLALVFLVGMIATSRITHRSTSDALRLNHENRRLLEEAVRDRQAVEVLNERLQAALAKQQQAEVELRNANRSLEERVKQRTLQLEREVAERKAYASKLQKLANYDPLTGLPNRPLLLDRLQHAVSVAKRSMVSLAVLFVDLDRFKLVNDSLGHAAGDELLTLVATRLQASVRGADTVARLGGDEFVVVIEGLDRGEQAAIVAKKILAAMNEPVTLDDQSFYVGVSVGISVFPHDGRTVETLLRNADLAMQRAKDRGRNGYCFYTTEMSERVGERLALEADLRNALKEEELAVYYQPYVDLATGYALGVEALLRWEHPVRGAVPAAMSVPLAEETGLIVPIGEWILQAACEQARRWQEEGLEGLTIAVNLSARQFLEAGLAIQVQRAILSAGIRPSALNLEITESMLMHDVPRAVATLQALKDVGVQLSIDDFGTGYSSLNYLKRFPLDWLKIDRAFVLELARDPDDAAIVAAIIALSHNLKLRVLAEGVETPQQLAFLRARRCDAVQGFHIAEPMSAGAAEDWLRERAAVSTTAIDSPAGRAAGRVGDVVLDREGGQEDV